MTAQSFDVATFGSVLEASLGHLRTVETTLQRCQQASNSPRVKLLANAFYGQTAEIIEVVERVQSKTSERLLRRNLVNSEAPLDPAALADDADSRLLTLWLVQTLNGLANCYNSILSARRLGGLEGTATELHQLFAAQAKRIAMEANRFEDL